jgi:hypothetical protein
MHSIFVKRFQYLDCIAGIIRLLINELERILKKVVLARGTGDTTVRKASVLA